MEIKKKILFLIETYPSGGSDKVVRIYQIIIQKNLKLIF